jgi:HEAT repeat protein
VSGADVAATFALALLGDPGRRDGSKPEPTIEHVHVDVAGHGFDGWTLERETEEGFALLGDDGKIVLIPKTPAPEIRDAEVRPVKELPSASLAAGLGHSVPLVRDRCEELLLDQGAAALPAIGAALSDDSVETRRRALGIVAQEASEHAKAACALLPNVTRCLGDGAELVRHAALHAYAQLGPRDLLVRCTETLEDDHSILVRHEAIVCLGRLGDVRAIDPLLAHLEHCEEQPLRRVTFDALRRLGGVNLGRDEAAWRAWWTNHRERVLQEQTGHD